MRILKICTLRPNGRYKLTILKLRRNYWTRVLHSEHEATTVTKEAEGVAQDNNRGELQTCVYRGIMQKFTINSSDDAEAARSAIIYTLFPVCWHWGKVTQLFSSPDLCNNLRTVPSLLALG